MSTRKRLIAGAIAGLVVVGAAATVAAATSGSSDPVSEQREEARDTDARRSESAITQAQAEQAALVAQPGSVIESHLESEGHGLQWEVKVSDGTHEHEIHVDPATGDVAGTQQAD